MITCIIDLILYETEHSRMKYIANGNVYTPRSRVKTFKQIRLLYFNGFVFAFFIVLQYIVDDKNRKEPLTLVHVNAVYVWKHPVPLQFTY